MAEETPSRSKASRLLIHPEMQSVLSDLRKARIKLPNSPRPVELVVESLSEPLDIPDLETLDRSDQSLTTGIPIDPKRPLPETLAAYDESIRTFSALEGSAYLVCHSVVVLTPEDYLPVLLVTLRFYSKATSLSGEFRHIKYTETTQVQAELDYMTDRIEFLLSNSPDDSLLLIDGPLIAGDALAKMVASLPSFHSRGIVPVFVVKNSDTDLVVRSSPSLHGHFNSDLHWANHVLRPGEVTRLFKYTEKRNRAFTKVFFYIKPFDRSPQRVEIHSDTFARFRDRLQFLASNLLYYYFAQGEVANIQVRPIAIAELFAREGLRAVDLDTLLREARLTPTMNQDRFGR